MYPHFNCLKWGFFLGYVKGKGLQVRLWSCAEVGLDFLMAFGEAAGEFLVAYGRRDNDVLAVLPVGRRSDAVVGSEL